jgi:hypothetical protein
MAKVKNEKDELCGTQGRHIAGGIYGLGFIGAVVYFIQHAPTFGAGVLGVLKALVWPAILVYKLLELVKL